MSEKLKVLTEKIYEEGVQKARVESEAILEKAKIEAEEIRKQAKQDSEELKRKTTAELESYKKKVNTDLRMAARKSIIKIQQDIEEMILEKSVQKPVKSILENDQKLADLMLMTLRSLRQNDQGKWEVKLPEDQLQKVKDYMNQSKSEILSSGMKLSGSKDLNIGYEVKPEGENYSIVFDDGTFLEFFSQFLNLQTSGLLKNGDS